MTNPRIYVVLNGELKMSPGKAAAQAAHAVMLLNGNSKGDFVANHMRTVIVLEAKNALQIQNLALYLNDAEIDCDYYIDEGANEVDAYSITAMAAYLGEDEEKYALFEQFPLYQGHIVVRRYDTAFDIFTEEKEQITVPGNLKMENKSGFKKLKKVVEDYDRLS